MNKICLTIKEKVEDVCNELKIDKKYYPILISLLVLGFIYVLPVFFINVRYNDDLGTFLKGVNAIYGDGRPLGAVMASFWVGGGFLVDIAPLPMLIMLFVLIYSVVLYVSKKHSEISYTYCISLVLALIFTNPLLVSNYYYRNVCFTMLASLILPFILFSLSDAIDYVVLLLISIVVGAATMSLYQPGIGVCIVLFLVDVVVIIVGGNVSFRKSVIKLLGAGVGVIIYMLLIMPRYIDSEGWRNKASKTVFKADGNRVQEVINNISKCTRYIADYFLGLPKLNRYTELAIGLLAIICTVMFVWCRSKELSCIKRGIYLLIALFAIPGMFFGSYLPLVFLGSLGIKARLFISLGSVMLYAGLIILKMPKTVKYAGIIILTVCLLSRYSYMYALGNAISNEADYEKYLAYNIAHDIETIDADNDYETYSFIGEPPVSKSYEVVTSKYKNISEFVPRYFTNDSWIGAAWLNQYLNVDLVNAVYDEEDLERIKEETPICSNAVYTCYAYDRKVIISFE